MKKRKKRTNPRRELAKRYYIDPESDAFLNKSRALMKAGYKKSVAKARCTDYLGDVNFTAILPPNIKSPQEFAQKCYSVLLKLVKELEDTPKLTKVSGRHLVMLDRILERLSKMFGMEAPEVKEQRIVKIEVPKEFLEQEYERRKENFG
jgi:hypothetical protein